MKVVIAGSRGVTDYALVCEAVEESGFTITEEVSGKEPTGVDALGERWAGDNGVPVKPFEPDWHRYTNKGAGWSNPAGKIRNRKMAEYADAAVIIWDGTSPGTRDMIARMAAARKPCHVFIIGKPRIKF